MNINATLFAEVIFFLAFVWLTLKYVWPPILEVIEERQKIIQDGVERAKESEHEYQKTLEKTVAMIDEAKSNAKEIMMQTEERARQVLDLAHQQGEEQRQKIVERANADIDQSKKIAFEELLGHVSGLTVKATKAVLQDSVDKELDKKIVDRVIQENQGE